MEPCIQCNYLSRIMVKYGFLKQEKRGDITPNRQKQLKDGVQEEEK